MKLTTLLLLAGCAIVSAKGFSQEVSINEKNVPVEKVFKEIRRQTGYTFVYTESLLRKAKKVSLTINNVPVETALDSCLHNQPLSYSILNQMVVIKVKDSQAQHSAAVPVSITGRIIDDQGEPLVGATIAEKGTTNGVATDENGNFTITVSGENTVLVISYVGYQNKEVVAGTQTNLTVQLMQLAQSLNEVVVIGYGTTTKGEVTGSIATISSKDFQKGVMTTPEQLIAGKIAGVSVTSNSGSPGAGSTIRIRGGASLNASNDPLIVIDGVPLTNTNIYGTSNPLNLINPNDIATFTVLKDASATAIYGSRASNGVILITTKKGKSGKPVFNFSTQLSVSRLIKQADVLTADEFRNYVDSVGTDEFQALMGDASTNWQDEIYKTAVGTDNNLSVSGSLKNTPYRISAGYLNQDGILNTDNLQRFSGGISVSPMLLDEHLKIDVNLKGAINDTRFANGAAVSNAAYFDPTQPVHADTPFGGYYEWYSVDAATGDVTLNKLAPRNPVALLDLYKNTSTVMRSYGNVQADYKFHFLPELRANLNLGYDVASGKGNIEVPAYAAQNYLDTGQHNQYSNQVNNTVVEFYLNYNKTFESIKSNINATGGYGYYNNLSTLDNYPYIRANGDTVPGSIPEFMFDQPQNRLLSFYGRLIYTYNSKYIVAASIRSDGSSRFSPDNRWGVFPSVAFTWRINQESFLINSKTLSDLKLRLSYGVTGNQDGIANYPYLGVYSTSDNSSMVQFGNTFYHMGTPAAYDAKIKWEQTATFNAGADYGFLDNRISGSIDVYFKKTKDLLNTIPIPAGSNFSSSILTNVGNIENKGVELAINLNPVRTNDISWDVNFNLAYNNSKITKLTATEDSTYAGTLVGGVQINSVGYSPYSFYVYHQQYDESGKPVEGVYVDVNEDGIINQNDLYRYQSPNPKYILGFSTQFSIKKWSLGTTIRANLDNYMYNGLATGASQSNMFNPLGYLANTLSEITESNFYYGQQNSDYFVQNASFLKMDNLTLTYDFGRIMNEKVGLRVSANCQNVFTVTQYTGIDPEIYSGLDYSLYPRPQIYSLNVNVQF
ncbi:MAG: TonB-dependent receptor [Chitinophagales bacterium]